MSIFRIYAEELGGKELIKRFQNITEDIEDSRERFEDTYQQWWVPKLKRVFASNGAENGDSWRELKLSYAEEKARRYGLKTINRRTDRFFRSVTEQTSDTVKEISKYDASFGSNVPYFRFIQRFRPVFKITLRDKREIFGIWRNRFQRKAKEQGFDD